MEEIVAIPDPYAREQTANLVRERIPCNLSFLSIKDHSKPYPDTGESGETYDVEAYGDSPL